MKRPSVVNPLIILATVVIVLAAMHFATAIVTPVLLALFFAALLTPIYRWLTRRKVPGGLALLLTGGFLVLVAVFVVLLVGNAFTTFASDLAGYTERLSERKAELVAAIGNTTIKQILSSVDLASLASIMSYILGMILGVFKNSLLILLVTMFALAEGPQFIARMRKSYGNDHFLPRNMTTLSDVVISYFGLRAIVNLVVAVATGVMLWLFGIPHAGLWTVLTFFLSFVPYIGSFVAMIPPVLLGFAQGGLGVAIAIIVLAMVINALCENIVAPMVMSKGLSVSPTVVFLSFIFWMFLLGGSGAFIAMPITVALILFMGSFEETRGIADLMGSIPEPAVNPQLS
jgi:AI-2 transport protein TqsA